MNLNSGLRASVVISIILHLLGISLFFFLPQRKLEREGPLMARLVTPEEMETKDNRGLQGLGVPGRKGRFRELSRPRVRREREPEMIAKDSRYQGLEEPRLKKGGGHSGPSGETDISPIAPPSSSLAPAHPRSPVTPSRPTETPERPRLPKEGLFDREVLDRLARKDKEALKPDKGITFDTNELRYYSYMQRLKEKIEGIWRYPPEAAEKGIYGDLYIRFTINKDGRLGNVELLRTSGYRSLDEAAMMALRDAEPFWPLPDEWKKEDLIITGHFIYSLYGVYLR